MLGHWVSRSYFPHGEPRGALRVECAPFGGSATCEVCTWPSQAYDPYSSPHRSTMRYSVHRSGHVFTLAPVTWVNSFFRDCAGTLIPSSSLLIDMPAKARTADLGLDEKNEQLPLDDYKVVAGKLKRSDDKSYPKRKNYQHPAGKYRGFVFTNFKVDWDTEEMKEWTSVNFASIGLEKTKTGRLHHQGCCYFKNPRVCSGFSKLLPPNTWFRPARGDECSNNKYTSKEGNRILLIGRPIAQGERVDLEEIRDRIINGGATPNEIACESGTSFEDIRFAETIFRLAGSAPKRTWKTTVIWLYGSAGRGKSHIAKALIGDDDCWKSSAKLDYWQQYQGQETVWFDEFRGDKCTFTALLEIMDSTPYEVNIKHGSHQLLARRLIVTSPMHPDKIYPSCAENVNQMLRRIDVLWEIDELYEAAASGFEFPAVPEFPEFGAVIAACSASRLVAKNPLRCEGTKCLELINNCWVPKVIADVEQPGVPGTLVVRTQSRRGRAPTTIDSVSGTEVGGNIRSDTGVVPRPVSSAPTSGLTSEPPCEYKEDKFLLSVDDCQHEASAEDEAGNEICYGCGAMGIVNNDGIFEPFVTGLPSDDDEGDEGDTFDDDAMSDPPYEDEEFGQVQIAQPLR
nr:putative replication associated protein [Crucivirus sp.]